MDRRELDRCKRVLLVTVGTALACLTVANLNAALAGQAIQADQTHAAVPEAELSECGELAKSIAEADLTSTKSGGRQAPLKCSEQSRTVDVINVNIYRDEVGRPKSFPNSTFSRFGSARGLPHDVTGPKLYFNSARGKLEAIKETVEFISRIDSNVSLLHVGDDHRVIYDTISRYFAILQNGSVVRYDDLAIDRAHVMVCNRGLFEILAQSIDINGLGFSSRPQLIAGDKGILLGNHQIADVHVAKTEDMKTRSPNLEGIVRVSCYDSLEARAWGRVETTSQFLKFTNGAVRPLYPAHSLYNR